MPVSGCTTTRGGEVACQCRSQILPFHQQYQFNLCVVLLHSQRGLHTPCARDETPPNWNVIWHYFRGALQILDTNCQVTDNTYNPFSGSDVALSALFSDAKWHFDSATLQFWKCNVAPSSCFLRWWPTTVSMCKPCHVHHDILCIPLFAFRHFNSLVQVYAPNQQQKTIWMCPD